MRIAFIGYGNVGAPLADHLQRAGHDVTLAAADAASDSVAKARARNAGLGVAAPLDAVRQADVVFLATPFQANEAALAAVAPALIGKVLVDCTNPVGPGLTHGLQSAQAGSQRVQAHAPDAKVVKAFSIYGFENFENSAYPAYAVKPAMLYCGDDAAAKATVGALIAQLGWEPVDVGGLEQALHLEHMTLMWVRMVRMKGASPHLVWAALRRASPGV
jgi:predicted dinucleotide-binding enzyme